MCVFGHTPRSDHLKSMIRIVSHVMHLMKCFFANFNSLDTSFRRFGSSWRFDADVWACYKMFLVTCGTIIQIPTPSLVSGLPVNLFRIDNRMSTEIYLWHNRIYKVCLYEKVVTCKIQCLQCRWGGILTSQVCHVFLSLSRGSLHTPWCCQISRCIGGVHIGYVFLPSCSPPVFNRIFLRKQQISIISF